MADWRERYKTVGEVRGKGLMIGVEIVRDQKTKEKAPDLRNRIIDLAFHKGLADSWSRRKFACVSAPPLMIDAEQAEFAVRTLGECIGEVERTLSNRAGVRRHDCCSSVELK